LDKAPASVIPSSLATASGKYPVLVNSPRLMRPIEKYFYSFTVQINYVFIGFQVSNITIRLLNAAISQEIKKTKKNNFHGTFLGHWLVM